MNRKYAPCWRCKNSGAAKLVPVKVLIGDNHYKVRCSCGFETDHFETKEDARDAWNVLWEKETTSK